MGKLQYTKFCRNLYSLHHSINLNNDDLVHITSPVPLYIIVEFYWNYDLNNLLNNV